MSDILDIDDRYKDQAIQDCESRIRRGTAVAFMKNTEGWDILLETFEDMKQNQLEELSRYTPGKDKDILAAHSVWYSVVHTLEQIKSAVDFAIQDGETAKVELAQLKQTPEEREEY